jgi:hypothetical protein
LVNSQCAGRQDFPITEISPEKFLDRTHPIEKGEKKGRKNKTKLSDKKIVSLRGISLFYSRFFFFHPVAIVRAIELTSYAQ